MRRAIVLILLAAAIVLGAFWFARSVEKSRYYWYRDFAVASCQQGAFGNAYTYLQTALQHARDSGDGDLVSEGLHYQRLFDASRCDE